MPVFQSVEGRKREIVQITIGFPCSWAVFISMYRKKTRKTRSVTQDVHLLHQSSAQMRRFVSMRRDPLRQITLDRIKLKLNFCFNHPDVSGNDTLVLSEINSASLWENRLVSLLIPPLDEKTRGVKVPYSSFNIRTMYFLFFLHSLVFI